MPTDPDRNFWPSPSSISNSGIASMNIITKNGMINDPPPYFCTKYGKRHTLPKPTPKARQANRNCVCESHDTSSFGALSSVFSSTGLNIKPLINYIISKLTHFSVSDGLAEPSAMI